MATNKERIEILEQGLGGVQDEMQRLESGMGDRLQRLEETLKALSKVVLSTRGSAVSHAFERRNPSPSQHEESDNGRMNILPLRTKLEFPHYAGDDTQFFEFQGTPEDQKVSLASFHLKGEANQWWQWLNRTYKEGNQKVTWDIFTEELWARFGPIDCEDFNEAVSRVKQSGSLREYQK